MHPPVEIATVQNRISITTTTITPIPSVLLWTLTEMLRNAGRLEKKEAMEEPIQMDRWNDWTLAEPEQIMAKTIWKIADDLTVVYCLSARSTGFSFVNLSICSLFWKYCIHLIFSWHNVGSEPINLNWSFSLARIISSLGIAACQHQNLSDR